MTEVKIMDERMKYVAIEINFPEDSDDINELANSLEEHLQINGYHYYMSTEPGLDQVVLLISEDETGYIDTILEDRNIEYRYVKEI